MPELPEVEAARKAIAENCIGKKIKQSVVADDAKVIDGVSRSDFEASITGKTIVGAHRKGKHMWIQLDSPPFPSFHFGLSGELCIKDVAVTKYKSFAAKDTNEWPSKYSKLFLQLDDGLELSFTDKIRFARVRLFENPKTVPPISELGPDALLDPMTEDEFFNALRKRKTSIKALLLNQSFISGVGNWIADEVLYQAKIHPLESASSIPKEGCKALHKSLKEVIEYSVEVNADYSRLPVDWLCHYRWGKKPGKINGKTIEFITAGGRTSAYVPELQKLSGEQALKSQQKSSNKKDNEAESESEEIAKNVKPKGVKKTSESRSKKRNVKHKDDTSEDDEKKPAMRERSKGSSGNKKLTARKKSQGSESNSQSDYGDGEEVNGKEEVANKVQADTRTRIGTAIKPGSNGNMLNPKHFTRVFGFGIERKIFCGYENRMGLSDTRPRYSKPYSCLPESNWNTRNLKYPRWVLGYGTCMRLGDIQPDYPKPYARLPKPYRNTRNPKYLGRVLGRVFGYRVEKTVFCRYEAGMRFCNTRFDYQKPYACLIKPYTRIIYPKFFNLYSPLILV